MVQSSQHLFEHRDCDTPIAHEHGNLAPVFGNYVVGKLAPHHLAGSFGTEKVIPLETVTHEIGNTGLADDLLKFHRLPLQE